MSLVYQNKLKNLPKFNFRFPIVIEKMPCSYYLNRLPHNVLQSVMSTGVGIEIEVEQVAPIAPNGWINVKEASLRNNGSEWISRLGLRVGGAYESLQNFLKATQEHPGRFVFTERASIHIHLDCSMFSDKQIESLVILYVLVENPLFNFAGPQRKHNIFTVPFRESFLNTDFNSIKSLIEKWSKYSALNLVTLKEYGSAEFRIMEGNLDINRIYTWILILALLQDAARRMPLDKIKEIIRSINSDSYYRDALKRIFYDFVDLLVWSDKDLDQATTDCKMLIEKLEI